MKHFFPKLLAITLLIGTSACISDDDIPSELIDGEENEENKLEWGPTQQSGEFNPLPVEAEFHTIKLWETTTEGNYAFNHFPRLHEYDGRLYAMWMTHHQDEHGPGQTLRWTYSDDFGVTWAPLSYLFDPMDDINISFYTRFGRYIIPVGIAKLSDGLYVVGEVMDHPQQHYEPIGAIVRKINTDATLGDPFWGWTNAGDKIAPTPVPGFPTYPFDETKWPELKAWFTSLGNRPASHGAASAELESRIYLDPSTEEYEYHIAGQFTEQSEAPTNNGGSIRIWRSFLEPYRLTKRLFVQYSTDGINYPVGPEPTNIPSPRSLHTIKNIDGVLVMMGNPANVPGPSPVNRDPLYMSIIDPSTMSIDPQNIYTLRSNGLNNRFAGAYKGGIFAYPHFLKMSNGKIGVVYATYGKEDIEFSTFNLPQLQ